MWEAGRKMRAVAVYLDGSYSREKKNLLAAARRASLWALLEISKSRGGGSEHRQEAKVGKQPVL